MNHVGRGKECPTVTCYSTEFSSIKTLDCVSYARMRICLTGERRL